MAETKQVLFELNVNMDQAIESMAELEQQIDDVNSRISEYQKKQKEGNALSAAERAEVTRLKEIKKALQKEYGEQSRQVQNAIVAEGKYKDTLKGLCAELSTAKDRLRAMKDAGSPEWQKQAEEVNALNEKIKAMEASYGVFVRNVGNYESAVKSQNEIIAEAARKVAELSAAGKEGSEEFKEAQKTLDEYGNTMTETGRNGIEAMNSSLGGLVGAMSLVSMMMGEESEEGKKMQEIMQKAALAVTALQIAMELYDAAEKKGLISKIAYNLQVKTATKALKQEAVAQAGSTAAKVAGKVAQDALNKSMLANPIGLVVAAVVALVAGLAALVSWLVKSSDAQKEAGAAMREYEETVRKAELAVTRLDANEQARQINLRKRYQEEITAMMESGATKEEIDKKKADMESALLDVETAANKERLSLQKKEMEQAKANYDAQARYLAELINKKGKDAKATKEQQTATDEAYNSYIQYLSAYNSTLDALNSADYTKAQSAYEKQQEALEKAYARSQERLSTIDKLTADSLNRRYKFIYDHTKSVEENAEEQYRMSVMLEQESFKHQQETQKKKLALDLQYGKITQAQYKEQLAQLDSELQSFLLDQSEALAEHTRGLLNQAIEMAGGKALDDRLADIRSKYAASEKAIRDDLTLSEEEKTFYLTNLAKEREKEINAVSRAFNDERVQDIINAAEEAYKGDLRAFSASEEDRLNLAIEKAEQIVAEKRKAGLDTYADEAELAQLRYELDVATANKELALAWKNAEEQYEIQREFIEKQLQLETLSAEQRAQLEQELANLNSEHTQQKITDFENYANQCMEMMSGIDQIMTNLSDREVAKAEKDNEAQKKSLEKRLDAGLISQKEYDKQVEKLDSDLEKKKAELDRKAAIRQKAMSAMQIAINTATAIMRIWADVPKVDFGISTAALTAVAATMGAIQLAAVLSEPLPTAAKGGLVSGPTHAQGGVLVNTEGDERIISANPSRAFPELLNLISYIGKHAGIPDTGYAAGMLSGAASQESKEMDYDLLSSMLADKVSSAIKDLRIYAAITDIREADRNYAKIENSAKL